MRYAIVQNGTVTNVVKSAGALAENWIQSDSAGIGDTYENDQFTAPEPPPAAIPKSVSMDQARKAMVLGGVSMASVATAISGIEDATQRELAQIDWECSTTVRRTSPLITSLGPSLNLTDAQIDALFIAASSL